MRWLDYFHEHRKVVYTFLFGVFLISIIFIYMLYSNSLASFNHPFTKNTSFSILKLDEEAYGDTFFDSGNVSFRTILDKDIFTNYQNVIMIDFWVGGHSTNDTVDPVYDIALQDLKLDCDLLSPYLKWKLFKNGEELSNGSFDYHFDTIDKGRLVLTPIQQDLKPYSLDKKTYDYYQFYLWLSDSCQEEDITKCQGYESQTQLLGKKISGKIEVELYSQKRVPLVRHPSDVLDTTTCISSLE